MKGTAKCTCLVVVALAMSLAFANSWHGKTGCPWQICPGGAITYGSFPLTPLKDTMYVLNGMNLQLNGSKRMFHRFDPSVGAGGAWTQANDIPADVDSSLGGALAFAPLPGNYTAIYAFAGTNGFYRFVDGAVPQWTACASLRANHGMGCALTWGGLGIPYPGGCISGQIYALQGYNSPNFWRFCFPYDATTPEKSLGLGGGSWDSRAPFGADVSRGGALTYNTKPTSWGGTIYGFRGSAAKLFKSYDQSQNSWAQRPDAPSDIGGGGGLAARAMDGASDSIYGLRGYTTDDFWYFKLSTDQWKSPGPADLPWDVKYGGGIAYCPKNDYTYCIRGGRTHDIAEYHPDGDLGGGGQSETAETPEKPAVACARTGRHSFSIECAAVRGRPARFQAFDAAGRKAWQAGSRSGSAVWNTDAQAPDGVYAVCVSAPGVQAVGRLVIVR